MISASMRAPITQALSRQHIDVLRNRHVPLRFGGESVYLVGVDDYGYGADLRRAICGVPGGVATVLLAHNPRVIHLASRNNVSLVLSGHTHGGERTCLFLERSTVARRSGCAIKSAGTAWAARKFT